MAQMKAGYIADQCYDDYFEYLGELEEIFSTLYADFTSTGKDRAIEELSDFFHVTRLEENADEFFISSGDFAIFEFGVLEKFLNEKFDLIIAFIRRALFFRKAELGIYSTPAEFDDRVVLDVNIREKLLASMDALDWFLTTSKLGDIENYFFNAAEAVEVNFPSPGDDETLSSDELVIFDNENRPLK